ncbi:MAG: hypothetical protein ABJA81_12420 [Nocardioidaceae bacterium]
MSNTISLAVDVQADAAHVFEILSSTDGQRGFWTADCDVAEDTARFGFAVAPVDLVTTVTTEPGKLVRMTVTSGFPFWDGSTWEWELGDAARAESGTGILFRHYGFGDGYAEIDLAHTAQTWALVLDRLAEYADSGVAKPFFPAA